MNPFDVVPGEVEEIGDAEAALPEDLHGEPPILRWAFADDFRHGLKHPLELLAGDGPAPHHLVHIELPQGRYAVDPLVVVAVRARTP